MLAEVEVVQREVPPVVVREAVAGRPVTFARRQPLDPVAVPALHLHHVGNGVHGPRVARIQLQRPPADFLGPRVGSGLLEAEGVHPEHVAAPGRIAPPVRQHLRDAIPQQRGLAEQEVAHVGRLQRQQVARVLDDDVAIAPHGEREVPGQPGTGGHRVGALPVVGALAERLDRIDALAEHRHRPELGRHHRERRAQGVPRREVGLGHEDLVDLREGVDEVGGGQVDGPLVALERFPGAVRYGDSATVLKAHVHLLVC